MIEKGAILLAANYSNSTGYAWNNIYKLFNVIARECLFRGYPVVVSFSKIEGTVDSFDKDLDIEFIEYDTNNRSSVNSIKFLKIIKKLNIKYVYFTDQRAIDYRYALMRLVGVKRIIVHNRISVADPNPAPYEDNLKGVIKGIFGHWHLITADRIYAVSNFVRNRLIKKNRIPKNRVITILNGIDIHKFTPNLNEKDVTNDEPLKIFSGGRATTYKGIDVLIEATALLRSRAERIFEVRYAGDGPDLNYLRATAEKYGLDKYFVFLGQLNSTQEEVSAADIIVVPSIWGDACPSSVSEALASGKPLIATSVGGVPEIVGEDDCAILVAPGDPEMLCNAIDKLLRSQEIRACMGEKARLRAERFLDQKRYHRAVIEQLIGDLAD